MRLIIVLVALCGTSLTVSCTSAVVRAGPDAIRTVSVPANAALDSAYRRGDADAAAALMSESVVLSAENVPDLIGRSTIRDVMRQFFTTSSVEAFTLSAAEIQIYGDHAFERGTFVWSAGPKGEPAIRRNGRYMLLRVRDSDGVWKIHRYIENCLPAPCPG